MPGSKSVHKLLSVNEAERLGTCRQCGPVSIVRRGAGLWRCYNAHLSYKRGQRAAKRQEAIDGTMLRVRMPCCGAPYTLPALEPPKTPGPLHWWRGAIDCQGCRTPYFVDRNSTVELELAADGEGVIRHVWDEVTFAIGRHLYQDGVLTEAVPAGDAEISDDDGTIQRWPRPLGASPDAA